MARVDEHLENLFSKKFETFEVNSSEQDWRMLSSKLTRNNFLKFSFVSFNIYYLFVICVFAGTSTFLTVNNIRLSNKVRQLNEAIQQVQEKEISQSATIEKVNSTTGNPSITSKTITTTTTVVKTIITKEQSPLTTANINKVGIKEVQSPASKVDKGSDIKVSQVGKVPAGTTSIGDKAVDLKESNLPSSKPSKENEIKEAGKNSKTNNKHQTADKNQATNTVSVAKSSDFKSDTILKQVSSATKDTASEPKIRKIKKTISLKPANVIVKDTVRITKHSKN